MALRLLVIAGPDKGRSFSLEPGTMLRFGRGKTVELRLNDLAVSKVHCELGWDGDRLTVTDQGSTHGTFVNGQRVTQQVLQPGCVLRLGETQLRLEDDRPRAEDAAEGATQMVPFAAVAGMAPGLATGPRPLTGQALSHYAVGPVLAEGRSGVVYRADDTRQRRPVALKVLRPELTRNDREVQRFVRAMKTMLPVRHPNLVAVYGAGRTGPHCWCAMEYVEGESLGQLLARTGRLDWRPTLRVAVHVGRALAHAHGLSIVHRNVKPENVLVRHEDQVAKLGDLMFAKALEGMLAEDVTRPGEVVGDVRFLPPERAHAGAAADGRSDLYSLGALLYALLTGRPPLAGATTLETLTLIRQAEPVPPTQLQPDVPAALEGAVLRLLRKEPDQRHASAVELVQELEGLAAAEGVAV
jgi:serine/threonine protein kinase